MPTSDELIIFVHLPKTGGSTFDAFLSGNFSESEILSCGWNDRMKTGTNPIERLAIKDKQNLRYVSGHQPFGNHQFFVQQCHYITVLRSPVERCLSHLNFLDSAANPDLLTQVLSREIDPIWNYEEWFPNGMPLYWLFNNFQVRWLSGAIFGYQYPCETEMLKGALANLGQIQHVGVTEYLDDFMVYCSHLFGLKNQERTNENVSGRNHMERAQDELVVVLKNNNELDQILYDFACVKFKEQFVLSGLI